MLWLQQLGMECVKVVPRSEVCLTPCNQPGWSAALL